MPAATLLAPPKISGLVYVQPLGSGGFADVYQYEEDSPRRIVAVKVLKTSFTKVRERSDFETEADTMARLSNHPSIVSMYTTGVAADGRPYLSMEFCPGSMRKKTRNNPASMAEVIDAGVRLAGALETAHRAGILHRDIKPSNVLISSLGRPLLTDFGIAMLRKRHASVDTQRALSVPWAAPEVHSGEVAGTITSEVWALGATLYTFAAGRAPFEHADRTQNTESKMKARIAAAKYTPIGRSQGDEPFNRVLESAMRLRPHDRYQSMRDFAEALRQLQRVYGFDVTPFEVAHTILTPPPAQQQRTVTSVREATRAELRGQLRSAQMPEHADGLLADLPHSPIKAGLIGAAIAVAVIGGIAGIAVAIGWFG